MIVAQRGFWPGHGTHHASLLAQARKTTITGTAPTNASPLLHTIDNETDTHERSKIDRSDERPAHSRDKSQSPR